MMEALRRGTSGWIAKVFIGLLVLSFAVWGIADIFGGYGGRTLATVGGKEISAEAYRFAYQNELRRLGGQFGRSLTMEEARGLGLDAHVLNRLVSEAAMDAHGSALNLGISDRALAERTVKETAFHDASGNFNRGLFAELLRANGLTEQAYVALERGASVRRQLSQTVGESAGLPVTLLEAANRYRNEQRTLSYFTLPLAKVEAVAAPTEEQLKAYFDEHKRNYMAPEFRKLGILTVTPESLAGTIEVSEEQIKQEYEAHRDRYGSPERRHVLQVAFKDRAGAQEAHGKIGQGADFMEVAKALGYKESDVDLGRITRGQLADPAVAEATFRLGKGEVSAPIDGRLSTVLVKVTDIEPGSSKTLDDVRAEIKVAIAKDRASHEVLEIHDKIEDERAAGRSLSEIANEFNLDYREIAAVDRSGDTPDGKPADIPALRQVVAGAFASDIGVENDAVDTPDRGFVWYQVLGVTPAREKTFDEVRASVERDWRTAEERSRLSRTAQQLVDRVRQGETMQEVAKSLGLEVTESKPLKREDTVEGLPRSAVAQAFALGDGGIGSSPADDGKSRAVFKVIRVEAPGPMNAEDRDALRQVLAAQMAEDLVSQYLAGLRDSLGVSINRTVLDQVTGQGG